MVLVTLTSYLTSSFSVKIRVDVNETKDTCFSNYFFLFLYVTRNLLFWTRKLLYDGEVGWQFHKGRLGRNLKPRGIRCLKSKIKA
jgi:hypothetical protein